MPDDRAGADETNAHYRLGRRAGGIGTVGPNVAEPVGAGNREQRRTE